MNDAMTPAVKDQADHDQDENSAGTAAMAQLRQIDRWKVEHAGIVGPEVEVTLVEGGVDGVAEQQRPGELQLVGRDEHLDVGRKGIGTVAHAP